MELEYLLFDHSDEESGRGSFDAMASVLPARLPALVSEVEAVLQWAHAAFGTPAAMGDEDGWEGLERDWACDLQAAQEPDGRDLQPRYDERKAALVLASCAGSGRVTFTLTLSGSPAFCEALREAFGIDA